MIASSPASYETAVWKSLRQAIVESTGFQVWLQDTSLPTDDGQLNQLVHDYLEQTLSTLAY